MSGFKVTFPGNNKIDDGCSVKNQLRPNIKINTAAVYPDQ